MDEIGSEVSYKKCLSTISHALDEAQILDVLVDYVEVWFLLFIEELQGIQHLNGELILEATNIDHLWVLGH